MKRMLSLCRRRWRWCALALFAFTSCMASAAENGGAALPSDLTELSLNDLLNIEVTSVSKHAERLHEAAAAVSVLTGDEIRRSGVHSIAEALRMVPGLQVERNDALNYTVTSRGIAADKLEVRLDGRSVYHPTNSVVFWDTLDAYLPDIERIEVIRGPGAALWGANAVNGVINIVTRHTGETVGTQLRGGGGNLERVFGGARTGASLGEAGSIRFYALSHERGESGLAGGGYSTDGGNHTQAGFRTDLLPGGAHSSGELTVSGDYYKGHQRAPSFFAGGVDAVDVHGANLLTRWTRSVSAVSEVTVQGYYDTDYRVQNGLYEVKRGTADLDLQHKLQWGSQEIIYGAGYRRTQDHIGQPPNYLIFVEPSSRTESIYSAFAQDQISLAGGRGTLTLGSKFEHNDITGFEIQPNVRLGWRLKPSLFTWASVSRAVRTPNRFDTDTGFFCPPPDGVPGLCSAGDVFRVGNPNVKAETLVAYEWGLRYQAGHGLSADIALFHNDYDKLINGLSANLVNAFQNSLRANEDGGELSVTWSALASLDLQAYYAALQVRAHTRPGTQDEAAEQGLEDGDPREQAGLRVSWRPASRWSVDAFGRFVGRIRSQSVPSYTEVNLRTAWRATPGFELALVGENLLRSGHVESAGGSPTSALFKRSVTLEFTWDWQ